MTSIRLPLSLEERLNFLAKETGRTKSFYIREALGKSIDDLEDVYLAVRTLERIRSGEERTYSSAEVVKLLGLDN